MSLPIGKLVENINEIKEAITKVKENSDAEWYTNFYVNDDAINRWITFKQIYLINFADSFFVIRDRKSFIHLYFSSNNINSLRRELLLLKKNIAVPTVVDLLAKQDSVKLLFENCGYIHYCKLTRMFKRNSPNNKICIDEENFANADEAEDVLAIINENMDPLCEQIPDLSEIKIAINARSILVKRDNKNNLLALLYFERSGRTAYLRYWVTAKQAQGLGYGKSLYKLYESLNLDVVQFRLWVRDDNSKVKRIYENYGYVYDRLKDEVFVLGVHDSEDHT